MTKYISIILIFCISYIIILKYQNNLLKQENISLEISNKQNLESLKNLQDYQQKTDKIIQENQQELKNVSNKINQTKEFINESNENNIVILFNSTMDRLFSKNNSSN